MSLQSTQFVNNGVIPHKYTCDGMKTLSPPLSISGVPEGAFSLAIIMEDHDVPKQLKPDGIFVHWVVYNISADTTELEEGARVGTNGMNGLGGSGYTGPCPPTQYMPNEHRYTFTLYAVDRELTLPSGATKDQLRAAIHGHVLAQAQLVGRYKKML